LLAGYTLLTVGEFLWRAASIGTRVQWNGFLDRLKGEILTSIQDAIPQPPNQPHVHQLYQWYILAESAQRLTSILAQEPGSAHIRSCMGDARSFQLAEQLKGAFIAAGWTVTHDSDPIHAQSPGLRLAADLSKMPQSAKLVANALNKVGIPFTPDRLSVADKEDWYLMVGRLI
jgi:hypothetical protein